jgi:holliday junction DNA helicase RuvB
MKLDLKFWKKYQHQHDIFESISGNDNEKWAFKRALEAAEPVHILLVGPLGIGKTRFLKAIQKEYEDKSYFALSNAATSAGIINQCFVTTPRYLLLDEIEHLSQSAQASILSLLQDGVLTETKVSKTRSIEFKCSVFATCNSIKKLKEPLVSRFMVIEMGEYNQEEFVRVSIEQLKKRGVDENFAWFIASEVWKLPESQRNIRECVRLSNLCTDEADVLKMLKVIKR